MGHLELIIAGTLIGSLYLYLRYSNQS